MLDDLQWSDEATLELLPALAEPLGELAVLVIAAYRSDGLPRDHGVRRLRNDLRRGGRLDEVVLRPLALEETAELLASALGEAPSPALARALHDRTEGIPFFVEELASALRVSGAVQTGRRGLELSGGDVPLPDTVRDAVLISASELSTTARAAAEVAAVAGEAFALELVASLSSDAGLVELVERGLVREEPSGDGRSTTRSRARRCTRTCRGCGGGRCTGRWPRRSRPRARRAARWPSTGSARAPARRRARRCCAQPPSPRRSTRTATPPRPTARRSTCGPRAATRSVAARRSRATRAAHGWPASWPRPRAPGASSAASTPAR